MGIAPRRLWAWEPVTTTEHEYDDAGRLLRTRSRSEPEWDASQYALVAALADIEAEECPSCGSPMSECMSADSDPDNKTGTHKYVASEAMRCHATTARELRAKAYRDAPAPHALRYPVMRVERT